MKPMKPVKRVGGWRVASGLVFDALSGRLGVGLMTLAYASFAVVLLAYVSTQVYTSSLNEDIARLKADERIFNEQVGLLSAEYTRLASRARIAPYCEERLGMVEAGAESLLRLRLDKDAGSFDDALEASGPVALPGWAGADMNGITEARKR